MLRYTLLLFLLQFSGFVYAQCDSAEVREWLRTMNRDTVCITTWDTCRQVGFQSSIRCYGDSSNFIYSYRDTITGSGCRKDFYHDQLLSCNYTGGDTDVYIYYVQGTCLPDICVKAVVNDSLTRPGKKNGTFYDYYSEVVYDAQGKVIVSWTETIVLKRGKKFRRTVYLRSQRKFNKERIRMKRVRR